MKRLKFNFNFLSYERLLHKIAYSFHQTTGIELDDLFQEASLAYLEALKNYNPSRGKITTYIWWCIHNHLKIYIDKNSRRPTLVSFEDIKINPVVINNMLFERLSPEAQQIAKTILDCPRPFITRPPKEAIKRVESVMLSKGWSIQRVQTGIDELKQIFS
jgi:RNA polymerase sigma factor (sigma-70 family)